MQLCWTKIDLYYILNKIMVEPIKLGLIPICYHQSDAQGRDIFPRGGSGGGGGGGGVF